ncbi:MAG: hypothetical protein JW991_02670 [Candidatus Pacebacteria bacterium]|nr:hypothetical protein [Candidatus Paceibacterota bacterium]
MNRERIGSVCGRIGRAVADLSTGSGRRQIAAEIGTGILSHSPLGCGYVSLKNLATGGRITAQYHDHGPYFDGYIMLGMMIVPYIRSIHGPVIKFKRQGDPVYFGRPHRHGGNSQNGPYEFDL